MNKRTTIKKKSEEKDYGNVNTVILDLIKNRECWFPFKKIRKEQDKLILSVYNSINTKTHLFVHAPTGIGKTAAILSTILPYAKRNNMKVFFLTSRLLHHKLISETIEMINEKYHQDIKAAYIIGKRYLCSFDFAHEKNDFHDFCKKLKQSKQCQYYLNTFDGNKLKPEIRHALQQYLNINSERIYDLFKDKYCAYEITLHYAKDADVIVCDYNYLLNPDIRSIFLKKLNVSLEDAIIIFDEAHNLPKRALDMTSGKITKFQLKNVALQLQEFNYAVPELGSLVELLQSYYRKFLITNILKYRSIFIKQKNSLFFDDLIDEIEINDVIRFKNKLDSKSINELEEMFERILMEETDIIEQILVDKRELFSFLPNLDVLYEKLDFIGYEIIEKVKKNYVSALVRNLELLFHLDEDYFVYFSFSRDSKNYGIYIDALDASKLFKPLTDSTLIFMSGTLKPVKMYQQILLENELSNGLELKSPFPRKNKLEIIFTDLTSRFSKRSKKMYEMIAKRIKDLIEIMPGNVIVFFPSYYFLFSVKQLLETDKPLLYEKSSLSKREKDELMDEFIGFYNYETEINGKKIRGSALLAVSSGNFSEGVDFPGEYLKGVIIVGFPLTKPDLKTKALIRYYDKKFNKRGKDYAYIYPTIAKVMQNAGRCIRTETDKGVIIYIDDRYKEYKEMFADDVVIDPKDYKKLIVSFFKTNEL